MKPKPPSWSAVMADVESPRTQARQYPEEKSSEEKMLDLFVGAFGKSGTPVSRHDIDYQSCGVKHSWVNKKIALMVENGLLIRVSRGRYIPVLP